MQRSAPVLFCMVFGEKHIYIFLCNPFVIECIYLKYKFIQWLIDRGCSLDIFGHATYIFIYLARLKHKKLGTSMENLSTQVTCTFNLYFFLIIPPTLLFKS